MLRNNIFLINLGHSRWTATNDNSLIVAMSELIVCLFCFDYLHDEALERYMRLSKTELNKLESKVWIVMDIRCSYI